MYTNGGREHKRPIVWRNIKCHITKQQSTRQPQPVSVLHIAQVCRHSDRQFPVPICAIDKYEGETTCK